MKCEVPMRGASNRGHAQRKSQRKTPASGKALCGDFLHPIITIALASVGRIAHSLESAVGDPASPLHGFTLVGRCDSHEIVVWRVWYATAPHQVDERGGA